METQIVMYTRCTDIHSHDMVKVTNAERENINTRPNEAALRALEGFLVKAKTSCLVLLQADGGTQKM